MEHISIGFINILKRGADAGYWTVDHLDHPSPGWTQTAKVDRCFFKKGYTGTQYRNLLRESGYAPEPEPGEELDGVTTYNNDHPIPDIPF